jgi:hypothetical protein
VKRILLLLSIILLVAGQGALSQTNWHTGCGLTVGSWRDFNWFHYSISGADSQMLWSVSSTNGSVQIQSRDVIQVDTPASWVAVVDSHDLVTLTYTNSGLYSFEESALCFAIQSECLGSTVYNSGSTFGIFATGCVRGERRENGQDHGEPGLESFSFIGPGDFDLDDDGFHDWDELITGTDPTNSSSVFQIEGVGLDPDAFAVTIVINTPREDIFYGLQAHDGPPVSNATWHVLQEKLGTGTTLTFIDDVSGSLTHSGKTYRGFITLSLGAPTNKWITTVDEEFIAYPFLSSPHVAMELTGPTNALLITYGEGIYSNRVQYSPPAGQSVSFFRMLSTDNDPANAFIQVMTNLEESIWSDLANP